MVASTSDTLSNHASPLSDMIVDTPPSQQNAPSPTSAAVQAMAVTDRTRLFTQGKHNEMLKSMDKQQRMWVSLPINSMSLTTLIERCQLGCINFGTFLSKLQSTGVMALRNGPLTCFVSMTTIYRRPFLRLPQTLQAPVWAHRQLITLRATERTSTIPLTTSHRLHHLYVDGVSTTSSPATKEYLPHQLPHGISTLITSKTGLSGRIPNLPMHS